MTDLKLRDAAAAAVAAEIAVGAPAALLLAQWALESSWGLRSPGNNCFGIKQYPGCHGRQLLQTREWMTSAEVAAFLAQGDGRTARAAGEGNVTGASRRKYICTDWFATFPTLSACFDKRARLFTAGRYKKFAEDFRRDRDLTKLVRGIAPIYATGPDYADTLLKIMGQQNVSIALEAARGLEIRV